MEKSSRTLRNYGLGAAILRDIGIRKMIVLSEKLKNSEYEWLWTGSYRLSSTWGKYLMEQGTSDLRLANIDRTSYRLRIICSLFNERYTNRLLEDSCSELKLNGIANSQLKIIRVPGALEIPFIISNISSREKCDGILALGCILRERLITLKLLPVNQQERD